MKSLMAVALASCIVFALGCDKLGGGGDNYVSPDKPFTISSPELESDPVAKDVTCLGAGNAPTVTWTNPPPQAAAMAITLIQVNEDGTEVPLLLVADIPVESGEWAGTGGVMGKNGKGQNGYAPPCPPDGPPAMCRLSVMALEDMLGLPEGFSREDLTAALEDDQITWEDIDFVVER